METPCIRETKTSTNIDVLGPETAAWSGALPREGVGVGCPGNFAEMSQTLGDVPKVVQNMLVLIFRPLVLGCTRRGRTLRKDVFLPSKHHLSALYKTPPSKNPSKNLVFTENPYRCLPSIRLAIYVARGLRSRTAEITAVAFTACNGWQFFSKVEM